MQFLTVEQLHKLLEVGQAAAEISVRADMMALFGIAAKMSLKNLSSMLPMLTVCPYTAKRVWLFQPQFWASQFHPARDPITEHLRVFCFVAISIGILMKRLHVVTYDLLQESLIW